MGIRHVGRAAARRTRSGRRWFAVAAAAVILASPLATPPTDAWAHSSPKKGRIWTPPNTPLGAGTKSVAGHDLVPEKMPPAPGKPAAAPTPVPPLKPGRAKVTLGIDGPNAAAARKATGGAAPASGGDTPARAGDLPVALLPEDGAGLGAREVTVEVTPEDKGRAAGVDAPLITLTDAQQPDARGGRQVKVTLDLDGLRAGAWSDRVHVVALPGCALTTPDRPECRTRTELPTVADPQHAGITADVTLPAADTSKASAKSLSAPADSPAAGGAMVLAAVTGASGSGGSYAATPLAPSMAWTSGGNTGGFGYSYPIALPPSVGGTAPTVALAYNSAAVDGRTSATNSQSSWIGDGWGYEPGFIERSYKSCDKSGIAGSGDLCWGGQNATLALGGHSGTLVRDDKSGGWHLQSDDGSTIEQLSGAQNGQRGGEYWRVTTTDGVQYYFGLGHLPGGDNSDPASGSTLGVPVYSPNSGDACYDPSKGAASWCTLPWRWQLDYVVDTHQNLVTYRYAAEDNYYNRGGGQNKGSNTPEKYQRAGRLLSIGYGLRLPEQQAAKGTLPPPSSVEFRTAERCIPTDTFGCDEGRRTSANATSWPDVPIDQICAAGGTCTNTSPTFFSTKRLTSIVTSVLNARNAQSGNSPVTVDTWNLNQSFYDPGDGTAKTLWLDSITRTGDNGRGDTPVPAVTFGAMPIANRVDGLVPAAPKFVRPRISQINTETGGRIVVDYTTAACSRVAGRMPTSPDSNSMACQPVKWYKAGTAEPVDDWFDKPMVKSVTEQDTVTGLTLVKTTAYTYDGGAAWHRNDAEFLDPKLRTWDQFRGFQSVTTTTGSAFDGEAPKTQSRTTYLRGMDGDVRADGSKRSVQVAGPLGGTVTDSDWLAGNIVASEVYDRAGGTVQGIKGAVSTGQQSTATHQRSGGMPDLVARYPAATVSTVTKDRTGPDSWRTSTTVTTTDPAKGNRTVRVDDLGDGTAATPEVCTVHEYAKSTRPNLLTLVAAKRSLSGPCTTPAGPGTTLSEVRTLFDGKPYGQAGDAGDATSSLALDRYEGANPVYVNTGSSGFDAYGRVVATTTADGSTYDTAGNATGQATTTPGTTRVAFTPATGAVPTSVATTGPFGDGWTNTVTQDPGRGQPLVSTDENGRAITWRYDGLGRLTAVWAPDQPTDRNPSQRYTYFVNGTTAPSGVLTEWLQANDQTYSSKTELYDGLGRLRQTQRTSSALPNGRLITDVVYDSHGWTVKTSGEYYEEKSLPDRSIFVPGNDSQVPAQTWTSYDGLGRPVRAEFRSYANLQWATTTAYPAPGRVDVTPPTGSRPSTRIADARGRTTALWQYRTDAPTGNPADAEVTTYGYTPSGRLATRTDQAGNTWTYRYDQRDRQVSTTDPDVGTSTVHFDADSRIDRTTDATGAVLSTGYDLLGRRTAQYQGDVAPANLLASWTYDTLAKGRLTSSTRYVGGKDGAAYTKAATGYDVMYRPLGSSITVPATEGALAGTYTTRNTYQTHTGALTGQDLPAAGGLPAESISYSYTDTGLLTGMMSGGDQTLVQAVSYDAMGRPVRTTVGDLGYQVVGTQEWDWATGRVLNSYLDKQTGTVSVDRTSYTYTPSGRITSVTDLQDARDTDTQCYTYDHLGRLTNAWTDTGGTSTTADWTDSAGGKHGTGSSTTVPGVGGCNNATGPATTGPGTPSVGGPAPYWQSYGYDSTGNRTSLTSHDVNGVTANDVTTTQTFGAAGTVNTPSNGQGTGGPHALLSSTTTSAAGTSTTGFRYDARGNTTAVTDPNGTTGYGWNGEGKLAATTVSTTAGPNTTTYLYDADGNQLIRRSPGRTTLSLTTDELTLDTTTSTGGTTNVRWIGAPGGLSLTRVTAPGGGKLFIQAADPHGTNAVQISCDPDQTVTRRPTDPFGVARGPQPAPSVWAGSKGYLGGTQDDDTGLTSIGAREYDPRRARFISADPLLSDNDPQQWNAYAYSNNDPVNLSDPTGRRPGGPEDPWYPPVSNSTTYPPASFCATLACAQGTATASYWESALSLARSSTTASNGSGSAAKEGPCGVQWCKDSPGYEKPVRTILPRASHKPSDYLDKNPFHQANNDNGANLMAQGLAVARGAGCERRELQVVCYDFSPGGDQPMTIGDVLFYPRGYDDLDKKLERETHDNAALDAKRGKGYSEKFGSNLLGHEARHSTQWASYRSAKDFITDYLLESLISQAKTGGNPARLNKFEQGANLYWGGYLDASKADEAPTEKGELPKQTWYWSRSDTGDFFGKVSDKLADPFKKAMNCHWTFNQYGFPTC
ncbi:RHS repeat-associated core domain-containing protein [Kitasatospora sp. NPDC051170]|uniref:RHS repeat-associated core domain-containing protein n=1 Tax=Kitasatospora sp. NPDC051170 TaxID=3364056 RepID=UPI00379FC1DC